MASRRLREALPVFGEPAGPRRLRAATRLVRRVTRALGSVRELDVALSLLAELSELAGPSKALGVAVREVRKLVKATRADRRAEMAKRLSPQFVFDVTTRVRAVLERLASTPGQPAWQMRLDRRLVRRASQLDDALRAETSCPEASRGLGLGELHEVRIAVKKLRYVLEIAGASRLVATMKRTQDGLGRLHDLEILLEFILRVERGVGLGAVGRVGMLDLRRLVEKQCERELSRHVRRRQGLLAARIAAVALATEPRNGARPPRI